MPNRRDDINAARKYFKAQVWANYEDEKIVVIDEPVIFNLMAGHALAQRRELLDELRAEVEMMETSAKHLSCLNHVNRGTVLAILNAKTAKGDE